MSLSEKRADLWVPPQKQVRQVPESFEGVQRLADRVAVDWGAAVFCISPVMLVEGKLKGGVNLIGVGIGGDFCGYVLR